MKTNRGKESTITDRSPQTALLSAFGKSKSLCYKPEEIVDNGL